MFSWFKHQGTGEVRIVKSWKRGRGGVRLSNLSERLYRREDPHLPRNPTQCQRPAERRCLGVGIGSTCQTAIRHSCNRSKPSTFSLSPLPHALASARECTQRLASSSALTGSTPRARAMRSETTTYRPWRATSPSQTPSRSAASHPRRRTATRSCPASTRGAARATGAR